MFYNNNLASMMDRMKNNESNFYYQSKVTYSPTVPGSKTDSDVTQAEEESVEGMAAQASGQSNSEAEAIDLKLYVEQLEKLNDELVASSDDLVEANYELTSDNEELVVSKQMLSDDLSSMRREYAHYRKRSAQEKLEAEQRGINSLVRAMLPTLDAMEIASKHDEGKSAGLNTLLRDLWGQLESKGVTVVKDTLVHFDPNIHEAVIASESERKPDTVLEVLRAGYVSEVGVVRAAQVIVSV